MEQFDRLSSGYKMKRKRNPWILKKIVGLVVYSIQKIEYQSKLTHKVNTQVLDDTPVCDFFF